MGWSNLQTLEDGQMLRG